MWKKLGTLFYEDDACSQLCPVRVFGSGGIVTGFGLAIYMAVAHGQFDIQSFGIGMGTMTGVLAGGVAYKHKSGADSGA